MIFPLENLDRKLTEELDPTSFSSREFPIGFPSSERKMVSISCYFHSKQVLFPLLETIDRAVFVLEWGSSVL